MIPVGKYKARATEGGLGLTKGGREQVAVAMSIVDGDQAGNSLTWFGHFTPDTTSRTLESLRHLGWKSDDLSDLDGILDNEVEIVVEHDVYNGKTSAKIAWVNRLGTGLALKERLDPAAAKAFAARMRGEVVAHNAKAKAAGGATPKHQERSAAPRNGQQRPPFDSDDDVPF